VVRRVREEKESEKKKAEKRKSQRRKSKKRDRARRKSKVQEKVEKSRNVAPEGRQVGLLKWRVWSHLVG
jgi:hypothetical protein